MRKRGSNANPFNPESTTTRLTSQLPFAGAGQQPSPHKWKSLGGGRGGGACACCALAFGFDLRGGGGKLPRFFCNWDPSSASSRKEAVLPNDLLKSQVGLAGRSAQRATTQKVSRAGPRMELRYISKSAASKSSPACEASEMMCEWQSVCIICTVVCVCVCVPECVSTEYDLAPETERGPFLACWWPASRPTGLLAAGSSFRCFTWLARASPVPSLATRRHVHVLTWASAVWHP